MTTRIYYDTEFLDDGKEIHLVSIGMVTEHHDPHLEFYAINLEMPQREVREHPWLNENVWPHLPKDLAGWLNIGGRFVQSRSRIKSAIHYLFALFEMNIELWAYCGAYDHVALAQLWGPMISAPIPKFTHEIKQEVERTGFDKDSVPKDQFGEQHNALADAKWNRAVMEGIGERR